MISNFYSLIIPVESLNCQDQNYYIPCSNCQNLMNIEIQKNNLLKQLTSKFAQIQMQNKKINKQNEDLKAKIHFYEEQRRKKRIMHRRNQTQLQKIVKCPYSQCEKQYASQVALNLHLKLKHEGGTKKQRQSLAKKIILAQKKNLPIPTSRIVLPPNYLQNFKKELFQNLNQFDAESDFFCSEQNQ